MTRLHGRTAIRAAAICALMTTAATAALAAEPPVPSRTCKTTAATCIFGGGATLPAVDYSWDVPTFSPPYTSEMGAQLALTPTVDFTYWNKGSGAGRAAFLTNVSTGLSGVAGQTVHYGASDAYLSATEASTPLPSGGRKIQLPMIGVAVALPFRLPPPAHPTLGSQVAFFDAQLCGIFAGTITNWGDSKLTSAYASTLSPKPTGPITVVYRSDNSGTTFLLAQHLSFVCGSSSPFAQFNTLNAAGNAGKFASYFPSGFPAGSTFIGESGSGGVAAEVLALSSAIGYVSPDYTSLNPASPATSSLLAASVRNTTDSNLAYQPNYANTYTAITNPGANSKNTTAPNTLALAQDPTKWIPVIPTPAKGYPVVGFTTWDIAQCYSDPKVQTGLQTFLLNHFNGQFTSIIKSNGFVPPVPVSYVTQIKNVFFSNVSRYNLNIGNTTGCAGVTRR